MDPVNAGQQLADAGAFTAQETTQRAGSALGTGLPKGHPPQGHFVSNPQGERRDKKVAAAIKALTNTFAADTVDGTKVAGGGVTIEFKNLECLNRVQRSQWITHPFRRRLAAPSGVALRQRVLADLQGYAMPGQFFAIMGPEGSGKSTLIRILGGRLHRSKLVSGTVTYNGAPYSKAMMKGIGYVAQESVLQGNLTVKESLFYAAKLRMPADATDIDHVVRVEHILDSMDLTQCADQVVEQTLVNEKRRLCIGLEMVMNPAVLLLDEPTSGLDGALALRVTRSLSAYASTGRTVIATMNQPSSRVYGCFSIVLLLADGHPLYFGPAKDALDYFGSKGHHPTYQCSPAEYLLDLAVSEPSDGSIHYGTTTTLIHEWRKRQQEDPPVSSTSQTTTLEGPPARNRWNLSWCRQFWTLLARNSKAYELDPYIRLHFFGCLLSALLVGCYFYKASDDRAGVRDEAGALFAITAYFSLLPMLTALIIMHDVLPVVLKERASGLYQTSAYLASHFLLEFPLEVLLPILFNLISYWMVGFNPGFGKFVLHVLVTIANTTVSSSLGMAVGAGVDKPKTGVLLGCLMVWFSLLFTHFFALNPPSWTSWLQYLSFTTYTYKLYLRINFEDGSAEYECNEPPIYRCTADTDPDIENYTEIPGGGAVEAVALVAFLFGYRVLCYIMLRWRTRSEARF